MLTAPASNEFRYFASYMDAKGHCPQVVRPWSIVTSAFINKTGLSWLYLSIFQGSGAGGRRKHIIPTEAEFQGLASLGEAIQARMFVLEFSGVKIHPYIFGLSWAGGVERIRCKWVNAWLLSSPKWIVLLCCVKDPHPAPAEAVLQWWPPSGTNCGFDWIQTKWVWLENGSPQFHHSLMIESSTSISLTFLGTGLIIRWSQGQPLHWLKGAVLVP